MKTYELTPGNRAEIETAIYKMSNLIFDLRKIEAEGEFSIPQIVDLVDLSGRVEEANNRATVSLDFTQMDADDAALKEELK